jgi:DNA invertase Pin-like site-specific DNA recombinase
MTKAFVYLRVSGRGQIEGDGFDRQLLACQKFARENDCEIAESFEERGVCGETELEDRPALSELFAALEENGIKTVIIERLDRLARDLMVQETIVADMQRHGYVLLSTCEPDLCSKDPSRVLVRQIFGAIAQYEKAMIVLKLRGARQRQRARLGKCEGRKSFGEKPEEAQTLEYITTWATNGVSARAIAEALNDGNYKTRSGKPWARRTVAKIVSRMEIA